MPADKSPAVPAKRHIVNIIVNPKAGRYCSKRMQRILDGINATTHVIETTHAGHARELAETLSPDCPVFVAGGDGTVNEVINGLITAKQQGRIIPPIGVIPAGTANVLAHEMRIANRTRDIIDYINAAHGIDVYPGMVNNRGFMLMVGAGPDAATVAGVSARLKSLLGKWAYVWRGLHTLLHPPKEELTVCIDGKTYKSSAVIVSRSRYYGGPYILTPLAGLWAPKLVVLLLRSNKSWDLLRYAVCLILSRLHTQSDIRVLQASNVIIT
ncbi:MAG: diacylglycerol kinase family protein, partial [Haliea sp.]